MWKPWRWIRHVPEPERSFPEELWWLADAPMFIDERKVDALYDAILRPDYEGVSVSFSDSTRNTASLGTGAKVGSVFPFLKGELQVQAEAERARERGQEQVLRVVTNASRHLSALALYYAENEDFRTRLLLASAGETLELRTAADPDEKLSPEKLRDRDFIVQPPRLLLFLDILPGAKFIPAALELTSGKVMLLYDRFAELLERNPDSRETYPGRTATDEEREKYWRWFAEKFDDPKAKADVRALELVENVVTDHGERIEWIAFRVPVINANELFLHLHIAGRGQYETGAFAYNLISRALKHGIRLVGTLKSEPDMNVLAIYER